MKRGLGSRGISPVIATLLLILLTIILFLIVFLWARQFIEEQITKFDGPIENSCADINLDVSVRSGGKLAVVNKGNLDIYGIDVKRDEGDGNEVVVGLDKSHFPIYAGESEEFSDFTVGPGEKVTVYPVLLGVGEDDNNKPYTCLENGVEVR